MAFRYPARIRVQIHQGAGFSWTSLSMSILLILQAGSSTGLYHSPEVMLNHVGELCTAYTGVVLHDFMSEEGCWSGGMYSRFLDAGVDAYQHIGSGKLAFEPDAWMLMRRRAGWVGGGERGFQPIFADRGGASPFRGVRRRCQQVRFPFVGLELFAYSIYSLEEEGVVYDGISHPAWLPGGRRRLIERTLAELRPTR